ncbi:conserved hypothetical protein [Oleispira antarctica RB-8]|uniref:MFS transporter n=1 Tax=Oleispira antarctica RB-8 TaxID=698738 RepID=R4YU42_OLEAN|nr:conserved hypothetical protein [Oleispira antarctica RB-8]
MLSHNRIQRSVQSWLHKAPQGWFIVFAISAAFLTYFSMYAFRKPFSVGLYNQDGFFGVDFKVLLILSQVLGYMFSKYIGIGVISGMLHNRRAWMIICLVMLAEGALFLFAVLPAHLKPFAMFLNGLPLGMIWGLVFSYLEGRKTSELLGAGLSATFIVASGMVRSVGKGLIVYWDVEEFWMPVLTGLIFMPLLFISVYALSLLPEPDAEDEALRNKREPMSGSDRWQLFSQHWFGLLALIFAFMMFTGLRDFRDNFSSEIWMALGFGSEPAIFTYAGIRIAGMVLIALALLMLIRDNFKAFTANHLAIVIGCGIMVVSTGLFQQGSLDSKVWMVALGTGLYLAYIPFNCFLFDRFVAVAGPTMGISANAGFLIYLADSAGYTGSVGLLLVKHFYAPDISWLHFFIESIYVTAFVGGGLVVSSWLYFQWKWHLQWQQQAGNNEIPQPLN